MSAGPFAILLLSLALANIVVLITIVRRSKVSEPACGGCGYAVRGLESIRCPECGRRLPEIGIVTRRMVPAVPSVLLAVLGAVIFTAFLPLPIGWSLRMRDLLDPPRVQVTDTANFVGAGDSVTIAFDVVIRGTDTERGSFGLTYGASGGPQLDVEVVDGALQVTTPGLSPPAALRQWLVESGVANKTDEEIENLQGMTEVIIRNLERRSRGDSWLATGPLSSMGTTRAARQLPREWWMVAGLFALWAGIWLAGVLMIMRWAVRRHRRHAGVKLEAAR